MESAQQLTGGKHLTGETRLTGVHLTGGKRLTGGMRRRGAALLCLLVTILGSAVGGGGVAGASAAVTSPLVGRRTDGPSVVWQADAPGAQGQAAGSWTALLELARARSAARAAFSDSVGAVVEPTADGRVFTLFWSPSPYEPLGDRPVIVTLHGSDGFAFNEIALWHAHAASHGYAILALQWWLGSGDGIDDYLRPRESYAALASALRVHGATPGRALLHGFSRGSANMYGVTALDRTEGDRWFRFVVANSGGATPGYPVNRDISAGLFGPSPFVGTVWATFCGGRDPTPERDGCPAMRRTATWVQGLGGELDLAIEDPASGHGGFQMTPSHVEAVLDRFGQRLGQ